jgi:hypothetical protein
MAKRKKGPKVQQRAKLRRGSSVSRGRTRKPARAKAAKRSTAKPKRAPMKKAARRIKRPVAPVAKIVGVEVIEQPAPRVITATEDEETPE